MARLHVGLLSTAKNKRDILKALDSLPPGLNEIYDEIIDRILSQDADEAELAKSILGWITYAKTPLTTKQLQQALAVPLNSTYYDEDTETDEQILISACLGIVTIDHETNIIQLVHYTTQEYIEGIRETQFPEAQTLIAKTCLTCLGFDRFTQRAIMLGKQVLDDYVFLRYATRFWAEHINDVKRNPGVQETALRFLTEKRNHDAIYAIVDGWLLRPKGGTLLHAMAWYGLVTIYQIVLVGTFAIPRRYLSALDYI